jgi:type I restriction enzyme S subunit
VQAGRQRSPHFTEGDLRPYRRVANIFEGYIETSDVLRMRFTEAEYERYCLRHNDILLNEGQSLELVGRCALYRGVPKNCCFQNTLVRFRHSDAIIPDFALILFTYFQHKGVFASIASQTTSIAHLGVGRFASLQIPLASLSEQKKIAEILSTWDASIEQTRKLIDSKKRLKKALMQQLLTGKKRLSNFPKTEVRKEYRFFDLPNDWEGVQIREIAEEYSERNLQQENLTVLSYSKHFGFVESSEYFGKQVFSEDTSNYKIIRRGYFGYPSNHIEEGSIGLLINHETGIVSPIYTVFKCRENMVPEFLYALFKTDTYRHIFSISTNASVDRRGSLRWREFSLIQVPKPSMEEQYAIVEVLQKADEEISFLEKKLKAIEKQKRGLMQKLLTGEVRVKTNDKRDPAKDIS